MAAQGSKSKAKNPIEKTVRAVKKTAGDAAEAVKDTADDVVKGVARTIAPKRGSSGKGRKTGAAKRKSSGSKSRGGSSSKR